MDEMQWDRQDAKGSMQRARKGVLRAVQSEIFCHLRNRFNLKILHYKTLDQNPLCFVCHFHLILLVPILQLLCELEEFPGKYRRCVCASAYLSAYLKLSSCTASSSHQSLTALKCQQILGICMVTADA